jgi:hypothetical protein
MVETVDFLQWQRVHVGAQPDRTRGGTIFDDADHAGNAQATHDRDAPFGQARSDHVGCALFFVTQFRMGVQVAPNLLQRVLEGQDWFNKFHGALLG